MRALRIDPYQCTVRTIDVEPDKVARALGTETTETIDYEPAHCLVIDDGDVLPLHPARFRFANGPQRPFFGPALILGIEHGNWAPATMNPARIKARIIWETWDRATQRYAASRTAERGVLV